MEGDPSAGKTGMQGQRSDFVQVPPVQGVVLPRQASVIKLRRHVEYEQGVWEAVITAFNDLGDGRTKHSPRFDRQLFLELSQGPRQSMFARFE